MAFRAEDKAALRNEPQPELLYDPAIAAAALEFAMEGLEAVARGKHHRRAGPKARAWAEDAAAAAGHDRALALLHPVPTAAAPAGSNCTEVGVSAAPAAAAPVQMLPSVPRARVQPDSSQGAESADVAQITRYDCRPQAPTFAFIAAWTV